MRMVSEAGSQYESRWAAITSVAARISYASEMLRPWMVQQERDTGQPESQCETSAVRH